MNIKQFNQPTLNHSDSFTLPTNLCSPLSSSVLPTSPPHLPFFFFLMHARSPPFLWESSTRVCTRSQGSGRGTVGTERGPWLEAGRDELHSHPRCSSRPQTSHFPIAVTPAQSPPQVRSAPVLFGTAPRRRAAAQPSHAQPGATRFIRHV